MKVRGVFSKLHFAELTTLSRRVDGKMSENMWGNSTITEDVPHYRATNGV